MLNLEIIWQKWKKNMEKDDSIKENIFGNNWTNIVEKSINW